MKQRVPSDADRTKPYYDEGDDITAYWNDRYALWLDRPDWGVYQAKDRWFEARFAHLLPAIDGSVLDWGCGNGMYSTPLLRRYQTYVGWDASEKAIGIARKYFRGATDRTFEVRDLGLKPPFEYLGTFDLVLSITVLQHQPVGVRLSMIEYIKRLLKPSGRYIGLEMIGDTAAYDMPRMDPETWRAAWRPLEIAFDRPAGHPGWERDNVWFTR